MRGPVKNLRVLHSLSNYLNLSENWIYPQVIRVPHTVGRVLCRTVTNLDAFPLKGSALIVDSPWSRPFGIPRFFDAAARRLGWEDASTSIRIGLWRPHILHAHFGTLGWSSLALKRRLRIPLVTSFYGYDAWHLPKNNPVWQQRYQELFANGDSFLVEGPAMRNRLLELGCPETKIQIQHIGVDLSSLPFAARSVLDGLRVAMVGRFVEKKGLVDGLRACALARSRGVNLSVTIVGDGSDSAGQQIKSELQALASQPELSGCVRFTGFVPLEQTRALLGQHNVLLCPSKHAANGDAEGGSPVVLTEAMALGLLCIGTRHCDIPEVIIDGRTGYLCNERDIEGMADCLTALGSDPDRLAELSQSGRKHVEENFSLSIQLSRARVIYESLLHSGGKRLLGSKDSALREKSTSSQLT